MNTISKRTKNAVYDTHIHLVFVTKYRKDVFTDKILTDCENLMSDLCKNLGAELEEFNGESDHVHLLVNIPPSLAISTLVNSLKGGSSRILRRDYREHIEKYLWDGALWSRSYYVGTAGGAPLDSLKKYIEDQDRPED